jgi:hypothetical protein
MAEQEKLGFTIFMQNFFKKIILFLSCCKYINIRLQLLFSGLLVS